jgi:Uma2 family endonuclease
MRLRIRERKFREPDILLVCHAGDARRQNRFWLGADLVGEAQIPEYWIVDP